MPTKRYFEVDRIRGRVALLLDDDRHQIAVPLHRLPSDTRGGDLLAVPMDQTGTPMWSGSELDPEEADRRSEATVTEPHESGEEDAPEPATIT